MGKTGRSVGEQEAECRTWVDHEGWSLSEVYTDDDRSASRYAKRDRPDWQRLMAAIDAGEVDVLVVWEPSRATRDRMVWSSLALMCEDHGVRLAASGRVYDPTNPDDMFQLDLFFSLGIRESGITRKRILRNVRSNAAAGRPHGRLLYGYRREYEVRRDGTRVLVRQVPDDERREAVGLDGTLEVYTAAGIAREVFHRVASGESLTGIARNLNDRGIPTPKNGARGWVESQVRQLALNPAYAARRVHKDQEYPGDWEPLVDDVTYYAVRSRVSEFATTKTREGAVRHLLTGIVTCGVCGAPCRLVRNRGYLSYMCMRPKLNSHDRGFHVSRVEYRVDAYVREYVVARLSQLDAARVLGGDDAAADELRSLLDAVSERRHRLQTWYDSAAQGEVTPAGLAEIERRLLGEVEELERRASKIRLLPILSDLVHPDADDAAVAWDGLEIPQQREVIRALFEQIVILPIGRGRRGVPISESVLIEPR